MTGEATKKKPRQRGRGIEAVIKEGKVTCRAREAYGFGLELGPKL